MDNRKTCYLKSKQRYLHLIYKITERLIAGSDPSEELIKAARELGRRVDIPEDELKNLGLISLHCVNNH